VIENKKVLAVIPARGGSKGIPNKNVVSLMGKPLINWTIEAASSCRYIDHLILSSDDERICSIAKSAGCNVPFLRASELATDDATTIDVVLDAIDRTPGFDLVVVLQPTSPLREASDIDNCLELLIAQGAATAVSVAEARDHPFLVYSMEADSRLDAFLKLGPTVSLRRQDLPPAYSLNGAIYIAEIEWLRATRSFVSPETVGYLMSRETSIDIDEPSDLERVRIYLSDRRNA